ncbi:hypothetical protein OHD62_03570 [Mesorhizobium sp. YC-39]|uniref:hypothetical protein n=1 Tax=unclassified Mesorhizobium TaxID=325217 RepID=UPI0021E810DD|nr:MULTISPECIES: hypothetical protein [unclassified Mesorhizobium]MCV3206158.1 hypothetical protein [Mesorhizobium sp. YC-2]MCV3227442.1 hypothetical protein [Mesorhizobium sp. YC-39]
MIRLYFAFASRSLRNLIMNLYRGASRPLRSSFQRHVERLGKHGQRLGQPTVVVGHDQRHAPLRHGSGGRREDQQQGKQQAQVEPPRPGHLPKHFISLPHE